MKPHVRIISFLLALLFVVPLIAACKDKTKEPDSTTTGFGNDDPSNICESHTPSRGGLYCKVCNTILTKDLGSYLDMIYFACDDRTLTDAYKVAIADCISNVKKYQGGVLTTAEDCIIAGADYTTPWTRDTAINVWNAFALLDRKVSRSTLLSVLRKSGNNYYIDGQYWDAMIWSIGAYQYILVTGDNDFLKTAQNAVSNSLAKFEKEEFDAEDNLFRGAAVYGDGVAAYPDIYANTNGSSGIEDWLRNPENDERKASSGVGIPMKALSTNCVYYESYVMLAKMNELLGIDTAEALAKADAMKEAINKNFWNEEKGTYDYLAYECDYQEAIGVALVLLFGIADERQTVLTLQNTYVTEQGIACVWPCFDRYLSRGGYGRHAGTIWPHAQGFWARACLENGYADGFEHELYTLAERAVRDGQFYEIYHPDTGAVYGGLQELGGPISEWGSCAHQTWSATAYLSCIYYEMLGATLEKDSVTFKPYLPAGVNEAVISGFKVGKTTYDIIIVRGGKNPSEITVNTAEGGNVTLILSVN